MRKLFTTHRLFPLVVTLASLSSSASFAVAEDRFAISIDAREDLVILGSKGEREEIPVPTISKSIMVGATSFQVSFGRDANDMLTAIISPDSSAPQDLHFDVLRKSVDSSKGAVVTLTFPSSDRVTIDPGYTGAVAVNSKTIHHRDVAESAPVPSHHVSQVVALQVAASTPAPVEAPAAAPVVHKKVVAEVQAPVVDSKESVVTEKSDSSSTSDSGTSMVPNPILPPPLLGSQSSQPLPAAPSIAANSPDQGEKLFWSEPITPPSGNGPVVGSNEMKLVEVQGPVSLKLANGGLRTAENGMIVPSGSTVVTSDGSSAAVFMGGVNSVRLLPSSEVKVTQKMDGSVRHTSVSLVQGTIFNRVGRREGETQDYQVKTPEGVAAARGTEFADHRGKGSDGKNHHYVFVAKGVVECFVAGLTYKVVAGASSDVGGAAMPPSSDSKAVLHAILAELQPFNLKLAAVLARMNNGSASSSDEAFYHAIVDVYFGSLLPSVLQEYYGTAAGINTVIPTARRALNQILEPFGTVPLTPF